MRQKLTFALGVGLGLALVRLFRRRRHRPEEPAPADHRAEELRRKLAETREAPGGEPPPALPEEPPAGAGEIDEARRRVHEEGRAAVEEMRGIPDQSGFDTPAS